MPEQVDTSFEKVPKPSHDDGSAEDIPPKALKPLPLKWSLPICILLLSLWGFLRLIVFHTFIFPLTFVLPLLFCIWSRSKAMLWIMFFFFVVMVNINVFWIFPPHARLEADDWAGYIATMLNLVIGATFTHLIIRILDKNDNLISDLHQSFSRIKKSEEDLLYRTEELEIANKDLESFSYSISHDLRSPLQAMRGFSSFLLEDYSDKLDEDGQDLLNRISADVNKMSMLIEDMLSLARISRQPIDLRQIDLSTIAESILSDLKKAEPARNVRVEIMKDMNTFADARLIQIALSNLIGNAWKYTSKTQNPKIDIGKVSNKTDTVFFIRDNGSGFDLNLARDKLFQPFHRFHSDSDFSGTGIGLSIVFKVIQRHNGRIWAESEIGKGATFYFTVPSTVNRIKTRRMT